MLRLIRKISLYALVCILLFGVFCYYFVEWTAAPFTSYNVYAIPSTSTGLVLGTSSRLASGTDNLYYNYRMQAAEKLFQKGKVKRFILSGDNRREDYNEPRQMEKSLRNRHLPDSVLVPDYAGIRTFDSMVRAKEIFGQDTIIVVSQEFHTARAVFIGRKIGLTVYGYNADRVENSGSIRIKIREFFSRIRCVLDIYVLDTQPRHLGEKIIIE